MFLIKFFMNTVVVVLSGVGYFIVQAKLLELMGKEWSYWQQFLPALGACFLVSIYLQFSSSKIIIRERK